VAIKRLKDPVLQFSDLDMDLSIDPLTNDVSAVTGENTVKQALKNLLLFKRFDKPFHPEINSGITDLLFEPASQITMFQMKRKIMDTITSFDSRIRGVQVDIFDMVDENAYRIDVQYQIQNAVQTFKTTILVQRTR
jgi:phage baseplate assembly protein W